MSLADDVDLEELVMTKDDLSGADIKAVCTEAGLLALRERRMRVTKEDFTAAREKVLYRKDENTVSGGWELIRAALTVSRRDCICDVGVDDNACIGVCIRGCGSGTGRGGKRGKRDTQQIFERQVSTHQIGRCWDGYIRLTRGRCERERILSEVELVASSSPF